MEDSLNTHNEMWMKIRKTICMTFQDEDISSFIIDLVAVLL